MTQESRQRAKYAISDFIGSEIAVLLFDVYRYYVMDTINSDSVSLTGYLSYKMVMLGQIIIPLMMMGLYYLSGYYNKVFLKSRTAEFITTFKTAFFGTLIVFFAQLINDLTYDRAHDYMLFLMLLALLFVLVYVPRMLITLESVKKLRQEKIFFNTIIVGYAPVKDLHSKLITLHRTMGMRTVAYVDASKTGKFAIQGKKNIPLDDIENACTALDIKNVVILQHPDGTERTLPEIYTLLATGLPVYLWPQQADVLSSKTKLSNITGEPLIEVSCSQMPDSTLNIKRASDIATALAALAILAVPMAIIAVAVKLDSPGPILYRQQRVGYRRKPFYILKFRTMHTDAEASGVPELSSEHDSRITKTGKVLRKYRLDELPQFYNVLRGDMSIVGPRPEREYFIRQIIKRAPYYTLLHQVRPGITSWGMVKYGYASSVEQMVERMRYDLLYLDNISFAVDMKIILHTAVTVLSGKGL